MLKWDTLLKIKSYEKNNQSIQSRRDKNILSSYPWLKYSYLQINQWLHKGTTISVSLDLLLHSRQKSLNGILWKLADSKHLTSSVMFGFSGQSQSKDSALASDWLRHFTVISYIK